MYPPIVNHKDPSKNRPDGKLRLLYECAVVGFIAREAGGAAIDQTGAPILDIVPKKRHQRSALYVGSRQLIEELSAVVKQ